MLEWFPPVVPALWTFSFGIFGIFEFWIAFWWIFEFWIFEF